MKKDKRMPEGDMSFSDESELAAVIRKALGAGPYEKIIVRTPEFERVDGREVKVWPSTSSQLDKIKSLPLDIQRRIGLQPWSEEDGRTLMLFPTEWYEHLPAGYPIVDINGDVEAFEPGKTDKDQRFGALPYGWLIEVKE